ncbi:MAG: FkbM family methyltransferase [Candidatus Eremiobacteraeota bacterium]|nr:FkbM family methyltransferase [Candidatus Eremiobacteraeota bacterium]
MSWGGLVRFLASFPVLVRIYRLSRAAAQSLLRTLYMTLCANFRPLVRLYYRHVRFSLDTLMAQRLDNYSRSCDDFVVLQLGANDGFSRDPIHRFIMRDDWSGVLVEPQPTVYERQLCRTYHACPRLQLVNAALDESCGAKELFRISFSERRWATGLSSFCREPLEMAVESGYVDYHCQYYFEQTPEDRNDYIDSVLVPTVDFETLFRDYKLPCLDLLQIDCEGYDGEVLRMFPFDDIRPKFVNFESLHLDDQGKKEAIDLLESYGYSCSVGSTDTFCEHRGDRR